MPRFTPRRGYTPHTPPAIYEPVGTNEADLIAWLHSIGRPRMAGVVERQGLDLRNAEFKVSELRTEVAALTARLHKYEPPAAVEVEESREPARYRSEWE